MAGLDDDRFSHTGDEPCTTCLELFQAEVLKGAMRRRDRGSNGVLRAS